MGSSSNKTEPKKIVPGESAPKEEPKVSNNLKDPKEEPEVSNNSKNPKEEEPVVSNDLKNPKEKPAISINSNNPKEEFVVSNNLKRSKRIIIYNFECSPSYIINNLSISKNTLYYIHNSQIKPRVLTVNTKLLDENVNDNKQNKGVVSVFNSSETNEMLFVKSISFKENNYLAIGIYNGLKLWNKEGNKILFEIKNPSINKNKIYAFTCCTEFSLFPGEDCTYADCLLSADNYGQLYLLYESESKWISNKIFTTQNSEAIISIGGSILNDHVGLGLDNGEELILKIEDGNSIIKKKIENDGRNIAINNVIFNNNDKTEFFLAYGLINGEIVIFSLNNYEKRFSINSNLRSIGPMIVIKNNEIIVGSDDGQINIWKYDDEEDKIILKENLLFEDKMIVGLAYEEETNILYANSSDFPEIISISDI